MIQRIQTLFLLGVTIIAITLFFIPLSEKTIEGGQTFVLSVTGISNNTGSVQHTMELSNYALILINVIIFALAAYTIFLYKKRTLQISLCMLGGLLTTIELILIFYFSEDLGGSTEHAHYLPGVYLAALQIFCFVAARRFIRKDEKLVRAADRIR